MILDAEASIAKAVGLLADVAEAGARLAVLPETFVSLYPSNAWAAAAAGMDGSKGLDELWERMWASSVDVPGRSSTSSSRRVVATTSSARSASTSASRTRPGTLYNTLLVLGPGGLLSRHRKLMPTHHERLFHGIGAGDDLDVVDTPVGRVGGLICWENRMPLARAAVYRGGPQIWVAPTADSSDGWQATMRHVAIESGAFVVAVPQFIPASAFPDDFPVPLPEGKEIFGRGGAVIVEPANGDVIAGPLYGEEGIVIADCDLRIGLHAKRLFDAVGHYGREDALLPLLASGPAEPLSASAEDPSLSPQLSD